MGNQHSTLLYDSKDRKIRNKRLKELLCYQELCIMSVFMILG